MSGVRSLGSSVTVALAASLALLSVAGCQAAADVRDAGARTLTSKLGAVEFKDKGHPVSGELSCSSTDGSDSFTVNCKGKDTSGKDLSLVVVSRRTTPSPSASSSSDDPTVRGTVVGKVDGKELFRKDCLGSC
jgi:hypothetical protein